jgi:hypothetical protein
VTVLVSQSKLAFVRALAPGDAFVDLLRARHVLGMEKSLPGADVRLDLVVGIAEHLFPARRVDDGAGLEVPVPYAFLCAHECQRESLFALAQRGFGSFALGNVAKNQLDGAAIVVLEHGASDFHVGWRAVACRNLFFSR